MNDKEILDRLWEEYRETPFASFTLERKLNLTKSEYREVLNLLGDMSDSGEVRSGYRIKRVASTMFKLIPQGQRDGDTAKGLPLIGQNEAVTGQSESDGSPYADAYCLPTDRACALGTEAVTPFISTPVLIRFEHYGFLQPFRRGILEVGIILAHIGFGQEAEHLVMIFLLDLL